MGEPIAEGGGAMTAAESKLARAQDRQEAERVRQLQAEGWTRGDLDSCQACEVESAMETALRVGIGAVCFVVGLIVGILAVAL